MEASNRASGVPGGGDTSDRRLPEGRDATQYVVLQQGDNGGFWPIGGTEKPDGHLEAGSNRQAVQRYLTEYADDGEVDLTGTVYVAVPARSWKPITVGGVKEVPAKRQFELG